MMLRRLDKGHLDTDSVDPNVFHEQQRTMDGIVIDSDSDEQGLQPQSSKLKNFRSAANVPNSSSKPAYNASKPNTNAGRTSQQQSDI